ncbi:MAG: GNAT family N-acetyltransferase [Flavobacteriales bacterium]|nr:GNAT family N-acetyltransferase [Flavobacteriales bacterium]
MEVGELLYLRDIKPSDVIALHKWENDPEVQLHGTQKTGITVNELKEYISSIKDIYSAKQLRLMIGIKRGFETIGTIDLFDFNAEEKTAGVSILIAEKRHREKGYGNEALKLLIKYSRETLKVSRLFCNIAADNEISLKLFEKNDFREIEDKSEWFGDDTFINDDNVKQLIR